MMESKESTPNTGIVVVSHWNRLKPFFHCRVDELAEYRTDITKNPIYEPKFIQGGIEKQQDWIAPHVSESDLTLDGVFWRKDEWAVLWQDKSLELLHHYAEGEFMINYRGDNETFYDDNLRSMRELYSACMALGIDPQCYHAVIHN